MKSAITFGVFASLLGTAFAQVSLPSDRTLIQSFQTQQKYLIGPSGTVEFMFGGANEFQETNLGHVFEFCIERSVPGADVTYTLTDLGRFSTSQDLELRSLLSNSIPVMQDKIDTYQTLQPDRAYNATYDAEWSDMYYYGSAIQTSIWEIIEETDPDRSLTTGNFRLQFDRFPPGIAEDYAEDFLTKVKSGTWTDIGGIALTVGDAVTAQDRIFVSQVPEPSVLLLTLLAGLVSFRRRRNTQ